MTDRVCKRIRVTGRVQGVFFRGATQAEARQHGVSGWIRNRADGSVEAMLEGPPGPVSTLVSFVRQGPPAARVDTVEIDNGDPEPWTEFEIRP